MAFDRTKRNCSLCYPEKCTCDAKTYALEKEANRFAKAAGTALPTDTTGRLLGGNHERNDRGGSQYHLARLERERLEAEELRHYLEILKTRLGAMRNAAHVSTAELPTLEEHVTALSMHLEGKTLAEISAVLGRSSHSFTSDLLAVIRDEASAMYSQRGSVAVPCRCGDPRCVVVGFAGMGRPRRYKSDKCREPMRKRRWRARRRVSGTLSGTGAEVPAMAEPSSTFGDTFGDTPPDTCPDTFRDTFGDTNNGSD